MNPESKNKAGFSLVEVILVIVIVTIVFGGLFISFEYSLRLIGQSRAKMTALSLMNDRLEYIRSLPYDAIGTVLGIPSGAIPQNRVVNLNGINFNERVLIEFVDDVADGFGSLDSNGILSDYKRIKIEYTWNMSGVTDSFSTVSNIVPRSIETTAGGGTLRVNVFDSLALPLSGVSVRLLNITTTSTIDVTRYTDVGGSAIFTGAPAAANYQIFVSSPGFSSDQTRVATTSLPNPNTLPISVLESDVSTMNFQIDRLSTTTIKLLSSQTINTNIEYFDDLSGIASSTSVTVSGGALELIETGGVYDSSGFAWLNPFTPTPIINWGVVKMDSVISTDTDIRIQFYTDTNLTDLVPEIDLPGNTFGFTEEYIDLRGLSGGKYPTLVPRASLVTTNVNQTPRLLRLDMPYIEDEVPLAGEVVNIIGTKIIGNLADSTPVLKYSLSTTTNSSGQVSLYGLEWDQYRLITDGGRVISDVCPGNPFTVTPNSSTTLNIITSLANTHNLRVAVKTGFGTPLLGATVLLTRPGYSDSRTTSWCGQAFFPSLVGASDYTLSVSAPGYIINIIDPFTASSTSFQEVILTP